MIIQLPWTDSLCAIQEKKKFISPLLFWRIPDEPKTQQVNLDWNFYCKIVPETDFLHSLIVWV